MVYFRQQKRGMRPMRKFRPTTKKLNKRQIAQVKRVVRKRSEPKHFDTVQSTVQVDRGGVGPNALSLVPQGSQQSQRVGDELEASTLEFRFDCYYTNGATLAGHAFRLIIFKWNIDNSIGAPTMGSVLQTVSTINEINDPYDWNAKRQKDFTILYDKSFSMFQGTGVVRQLRIPLKGHKIVFDPAASAGEGHIYALVVGDDVTGAHTPDISIQYQSRLIYHDG